MIATPRWRIETKDDCEAWYAEWMRALEPVKAKVDCVLMLQEFDVAPKIASIRGEYRPRLTREKFRNSSRVKPSSGVSLSCRTSGVIHAAESDEALTLEAAIRKSPKARGNESQRMVAH